MPFTGSTGPVVHLHGLTGLRKAVFVKEHLAIYTHALGVPGQYESVALMLSHEMDFIVVPIGMVFANAITYNS